MDAGAKRDGRRLARAGRSAISADQRRSASELICAQIISSARFVSASFVATYVPMEIEVDVWPITRSALAMGKRVALPLIVGDGLMEFSEVLLDDLDLLVPDAFGIGTPSIVRIVPPGLLDLIVVPLVGVDRFGNRIGGGKGYYDRKLSLERQADLVGVAFDAQLVPRFEPDPWDVALPAVVTESGSVVGSI